MGKIIAEVKKNRNKGLMEKGYKYTLVLFKDIDSNYRCYGDVLNIKEIINIENIDFLSRYNVNIVNNNLTFKSLKKAKLAKEHIESLIIMNEFIDIDK